MSRMHPGNPPSQRKNPGMTWQRRTQLSASALVQGLRNSGYEPDGIRKHVIEAAREALTQKPGGAMYAPIMTPSPDGKGLQDDYRMTSAGVFRLPLTEFRLKWSDPLVAESFMLVVHRPLDVELGPIG